jgi:hypothetical protein
MAKIDSNAELQEAIQVLESKQKEDLKSLKKEFFDVKERLKPKNLMKEGLSKVRHSSALRNLLMVAGASILSVVAVKKYKARKRRQHEKKMHVKHDSPASNQAKKISGSLIQYIIAAFLSRNSDKIKDLIYNLLGKLRSSPPSNAPAADVRENPVRVRQKFHN